jgi:hypothetical protein
MSIPGPDLQAGLSDMIRSLCRTCTLPNLTELLRLHFFSLCPLEAEEMMDIGLKMLAGMLLNDRVLGSEGALSRFLSILHLSNIPVRPLMSEMTEQSS